MDICAEVYLYIQIWRERKKENHSLKEKEGGYFYTRIRSQLEGERRRLFLYEDRITAWSGKGKVISDCPNLNPSPLSYPLSSYLLLSHLISSSLTASPPLSSYFLLSHLISSSLILSPPLSSYLLLSPLISSSLILSPPLSSYVLLSHLIFSSLILCPPLSSYVLLSHHISSSPLYLLIVVVMSKILNLSSNKLFLTWIENFFQTNFDVTAF